MTDRLAVLSYDSFFNIGPSLKWHRQRERLGKKEDCFQLLIFLIWMTELQFNSAIPDLTLHSSDVSHLIMVKELDLIGGSECVFLWKTRVNGVAGRKIDVGLRCAVKYGIPHCVFGFAWGWHYVCSSQLHKNGTKTGTETNAINNHNRTRNSIHIAMEQRFHGDSSGSDRSWPIGAEETVICWVS